MAKEQWQYLAYLKLITTPPTLEDSAGQGSIDYTIYKLFTNTRTTVSYFNIKDGIVRQSLTRLKVPRSHKPMKRRFGTTQ